MPTEAVYPYPHLLQDRVVGADNARQLNRIERKLEDIEVVLRELLHQQGKADD